MADIEKLEAAAERGLHKLTVYRSETGAWHAVALGKSEIGHGVFRTPSAAAEAALTEYLAKVKPDNEEDPFE